MSLLSCSSRTLRRLEIDCLHSWEDSARIAHCLRATPLLTELCLRGRGSGSWLTTDLLRLLTRQPNVDVLVPDLEVLELSDQSIPCYDCMGMIESRWWVAAGAHLKRVHIKMVRREDWLIDAEILKRLLKCRQEGMVISIGGVLNTHGRPAHVLH